MKIPNLENSGEFTRKQIDLASQGDEEAISELYSLTYNHVYRTVKSMMQDEDAVLDIVQDSYVKAFQSLDQLDKPKNFRAWMNRIATNKVKDYFKKKKPILFSEMVTEDDEEIDFQDDRAENLPEVVLDQQETTRLMNEILGSLSEDQRFVIGMYYYEQMSIREIAEILDCSENTVKSRLNYGRKKIEAKVLDLEKRGTKLYSLAPIPFLLWLFRMESQGTPIAPPFRRAEKNVAAQHRQYTESSGARKIKNSVSETGSSGQATSSISAKMIGAGGKVISTKIIASVLTIAVIGGGVTVAVKFNAKLHSGNTPPASDSSISNVFAPANPATSTGTTFPSTHQMLPKATAEDAYESIQQDYIKAISIDNQTYFDSSDEYINDGHISLFYYHSYPSYNFYYAHYDINHDGENEMLIGLGNGDDISIVDIYGFDGQNAVQLMDEPSLGERSRVQIMTDGTIYFRASSGFASSRHELLQIAPNGCSLEQLDSFYYDITEDLAHTNDELMSAKIEEENNQLAAFEEKVAKYDAVEDFMWNLLEAENSPQRH